MPNLYTKLLLLFSHSVMSNSLWPNGLQHAKLPCPPPYPGDSKVFSNTTVQKHQLFDTQPSLWSKLSHPHVTTGKNIALTRQIFVGKVMSLLFNMLSRLVIAFLERSKCLLIAWLQLPSAVILEPPNIKSLTVSIVSPSIWHELMGPDAVILVSYKGVQLVEV